MSKGILVALLAMGLAWLAFAAARYWQPQPSGYARPADVAGCQLERGACRQAVGQGHVGLQILPGDIPLMQTLSLRVTLDGIDATAVRVDIRGLNMDMGLNRTLLQSAGGGVWTGQTILPICTLRRMDWEAVVRLVNGEAVEVGYLFSTWRR